MQTKLSEASAKKEPKTYREMTPKLREAVVDLLTTASYSERNGGMLFIPWIERAPSQYTEMFVARQVYDEFRHGWLQAQALAKLGIDAEKEISKRPTKAYEAATQMYRELETWTEFIVALQILGDPLGFIVFDDCLSCGVEVLEEIAPSIQSDERRHIEFGVDELTRLVTQERRRAEAQEALDRYAPILIRGLGTSGSKREQMYLDAGVRQHTSAELYAIWMEDITGRLEPLGLKLPDMPEITGSMTELAVM